MFLLHWIYTHKLHPTFMCTRYEEDPKSPSKAIIRCTLHVCRTYFLSQGLEAVYTICEKICLNYEQYWYIRRAYRPIRSPLRTKDKKRPRLPGNREMHFVRLDIWILCKWFSVQLVHMGHIQSSAHSQLSQHYRQKYLENNKANFTNCLPLISEMQNPIVNNSPLMSQTATLIPYWNGFCIFPVLVCIIHGILFHRKYTKLKRPYLGYRRCPREMGLKLWESDDFRIRWYTQ